MKKISNIFWSILVVAGVVYFFYKLTFRILINNMSERNAIHIKAVIINEKNFMGNQPVDPKFSYSYSFKVNGERYTGDSHDTTLLIGDTVEIEYDKDHPGINKPLHTNE